MNPVAFYIMGMEVRWYGILIGIGMLVAILISYKRASGFGLNPERVIDFGLVCLPAAVIGARAWYVLFNIDYYNGDIYKIINLKQGGLAFHGGLIAAILAALIMCRICSVDFWNLSDLTAPVIALGQAIGRWGNYINKEAYGTVTNLPWAIEIDGKMVHPTFLYESVWCFGLFVALMIISRNRRFSGQIILLYGILYSFERFFVEGLRTDSLYFMGMRTAQIVSITVIIICTVIYFYRKKKFDKLS